MAESRIRPIISIVLVDFQQATVALRHTRGFVCRFVVVVSLLKSLLFELLEALGTINLLGL